MYANSLPLLRQPNSRVLAYRKCHRHHLCSGHYHDHCHHLCHQRFPSQFLRSPSIFLCLLIGLFIQKSCSFSSSRSAFEVFVIYMLLLSSCIACPCIIFAHVFIFCSFCPFGSPCISQSCLLKLHSQFAGQISSHYTGEGSCCSLLKGHRHEIPIKTMCLFYFLEERRETEEEKTERAETVDRQPITKGQ
jgi:hypothetical protein